MDVRNKIVAGNWKMNKNVREAHELFSSIATLKSSSVEIVVAPPFLYLESFSSSNSAIQLSAQNCAATNNGAFTGEISAEMLASLNISYSLVGHSERRVIFQESDEQIKLKINQLLAHSISPIFCCGESLTEREAGLEKKVILDQLNNALFHLKKNEIEKIIIAYEPVWAIGTGKTATAAQAQEMHAFIREQLAIKYSYEIAQKIPILYGGSCNASNAAELFSNLDVDGGLIGGASLQVETFEAIIKALEKS
jgi:triosephosphate isomerase